MLKEQHSEDLYWEAFISGNKEAYSAIYRIYYPRLYNYGRKFTEDLEIIEDCIQDIFIRFWVNRKKLGVVKECRSYLFVSFRNAIFKAVQNNKNSRSDFDSADHFDFELTVSIDQVLINAERIYEQQINLNKALENLTQRQKEAIFLKFYENMSYEEIAGVLNISTKATYKLVARAISELRIIYHQRMITLLLSLGIFLPFF